CTRSRGLGVFLSFYHSYPSKARARTMLDAARSNHSATLKLERDQLWPSDSALTMTDEQITLLARLLDARFAELIDAGGSLRDVALYPLMSLHDAYRLGQVI